MLKQAERLMDELAASKALLEIHYEDEVLMLIEHRRNRLLLIGK